MLQKRKDTIRKPCVAGTFYSDDPIKLKDTLTELFSTAKPSEGPNPLALIVPHAGYIFSGKVAASAYHQINTKVKFERIFILATSHIKTFEGAALLNELNYSTPLGVIQSDLLINRELMDKSAYFFEYEKAHSLEHSIEVQLPFLQYLFGNEIKIVPIVIGTQKTETCKEIANTLAPFFTKQNLFIISSDFSHYPHQNDAVSIDSLTAASILTNDPARFLKTIIQTDKRNIQNLYTSACGWTAILTLLFITQNIPHLTFKTIDYQNSGDVEFGDKQKVVGYQSIGVF